ncbi:MAG: penicillin-binding transpeptidase domain-containing protein [Chitinophagales bacterium]
MIENVARRRASVFLGLVITLFVLLAIQLFNLQVLEKRYHVAAEKNVVKQRRTEPVRGEIYDRHGEKIAYNIVVYDLEALYVALDEELDVEALSSALGMPLTQVQERYDAYLDGINTGTIPKVRKYPIIRALDTTTSMRLREQLLDFPGLSLTPSSRREYVQYAPAHLLGYMGEINKDELKEYTAKGYRMGDYIGRGGIESEFEYALRGINGEAYIIEDVYGAERGKFEEGINDVKASPGSDLYLTIDLALQQYARGLMENKKGAVVALDPRSGEILTLVSTPDYNLSEIMGVNRGEYFKSISKAPGNPFLDRTLTGQYQPGSTFKTISALIALSSRTWSRSRSYVCQYIYRLSGQTVLKCSHTHEPSQNIGQALMHSCNPYFWEVFKKCVYGLRKESYAQALDDWGDACRSFGLDTTLLDIGMAESKGNVPLSSYYDGLYGQKRWAPTAMISLGIGQGELLLTPLQMAFAYSIVANRGQKVFYPSLIRQIGQSAQSKREYNNVLPTSWRDYEAVIDGMRLAVSSGTAKGNSIPGISFGGKTGTVEKWDQPSHSMFVGMAPLKEPEIVIAVIVENGGAGGSTAAPIASLMAEKYLRGNVLGPERKALEYTIKTKNTLVWDEK